MGEWFGNASPMATAPCVDTTGDDKILGVIIDDAFHLELQFWEGST